MSRRSRTLFGVTCLGLVLAAGYAVRRARADGIPATNALSYSGLLEDSSGPITGTHNIGIALYDASTAGNLLCQVASAPFSVVGGEFRIQLPDACTTAVGANANVWIEVDVDGASVGRTKIGAVPYAVEANRAAGASGALAQQIVPSGAVMAFNLSACPAGWSAMAAAANHVIVGVGPGLTAGVAVGSDQVSLTTAELPAHAHPITDPSHSHGGPPNSDGYVINIYPASCSNSYEVGGQGIGQTGLTGSICPGNVTGSATTGITTTQSVGSGQAFDNRQASLPLLYCQKN